MSVKSIVTSLVILGTSSVALARPVYTGSQWSPPPPPVGRDHRGDNGFAVNGGFSADFNAGFDASIGFSTDNHRPDFRDMRNQDQRWNHRRYRHIDAGYDNSVYTPTYDNGYTTPAYDSGYNTQPAYQVDHRWVTLATIRTPFATTQQGPLVLSLGRGAPVSKIRLRSLGAMSEVFDLTYREANGGSHTYNENHQFNFAGSSDGWRGSDLVMNPGVGHVITSIEVTGVNAPNTTFIVEVFI
jgi:hypothetical protein